MNFTQLRTRLRKDDPFPEYLLCLDPGETCGWVIFHNMKLLECGELKVKEEGWKSLVELLERYPYNHVVCENYRVYKSKQKEHVNSEVYTIRVIGVIDMQCDLKGIPITYQMASSAKGFCTDNKLKEWSLWQKGQRHSRDAIRHGCYFLLFNGRKFESCQLKP